MNKGVSSCSLIVNVGVSVNYVQFFGSWMYTIVHGGADQFKRKNINLQRHCTNDFIATNPKEV
jgi:hypothetical protein